MAQDKKKAELAAKAAKKAQIRQILTLALAILFFVAIGGTGYYYFGKQKPAPQVAQNIPKPNNPTQPIESSFTNTVSNPTKAVPATNQQKTTRTRSKDFFEIAKRAIVSIETPWGTGLGFFIKKDLIVTSKHRVEYSRERYEEYINEVKQYRIFVEQKTQKLEELKQSYEEMAEGPSKDELAAKIDEAEEQLSDSLLEQKENEDQLEQKADTVTAPEIIIYLSNGTIVEITNVETSSTYDLALLSVDGADALFIELPPDETSLKKGDTVYSLGSKNKAIIGIFSQYHQKDNPEENYLETDSPINSKYNGAPLIDKKGYVYGVSTTSLINKNGFGSAIPIATVFSEFNL